MSLNPGKYQNKYRSATARAVWHDYNNGDYFITICTKNRQHFFGRIVNQEMLFSEIGKYAVENLAGIDAHYPDAQIPVFVVMPNHIHVIVSIVANDDGRGGHYRGDGDKMGDQLGDHNMADQLGDDDKMVDGNCVGDGGNGGGAVAGDDGRDDGRDAVGPMCTSALQRPRQRPQPTETPQPPPPNPRWKNDVVDEKMQSISRQRGRLSVVIGGFKRAITRYANQHGIEFAWQERFHDHIIRNQDEMDRIATYIRNNPMVWEEDAFYNE